MVARISYSSKWKIEDKRLPPNSRPLAATPGPVIPWPLTLLAASFNSKRRAQRVFSLPSSPLKTPNTYPRSEGFTPRWLLCFLSNASQYCSGRFRPMSRMAATCLTIGLIVVGGTKSVHAIHGPVSRWVSYQPGPIDRHAAF